MIVAGDDPFDQGDYAHVKKALHVGGPGNFPTKPDNESFSGTYKGVSVIAFGDDLKFTASGRFDVTYVP